MKKVIYISIYLLCECLVARAQPEFVENKGQWPEQVAFRASLSTGTLWAETNCFTYHFFDPEILSAFHRTGKPSQNSFFRGHTYKVHFVDSQLPFVAGAKAKKHHYNYYQGNDPAKWASNCGAYQRCDYADLYPGIDLVLYSTDRSLKYDFIIRQGANPDNIRLEIEGAEVSLQGTGKSREMLIKTSVNTITEKAPYAYQLINGQVVEVACGYELEKNRISFNLGSYDVGYDLIIDPEIAFSTYIGSPASNFGFTACDDSQGHLISGAAVFAENYPTTTGAYSVDFNSAPENYMDVALSKFSIDGTQLLYSTYIGGAGQETPHSVVADNNDNFIVMGVTGSADYPTTAGCWQNTFAGGPFLNMGDFFTSFHADGTDFFISKFNANGTLDASTFAGGTDIDGLNYADQLFYNYGDAFRGEVNIDNNNNIFIASVTRSADFPMTGASTQSSYGGGPCDGVVFKMNPSLTNMDWSTYIGGSAPDACYAVEFTSSGTLVIAGGTQSSNFPHVPGGAADDSHNGQTDGFITLLNNSNFNVSGGTFIGTNEYDQVYFVQMDDADNIYGYGQTAGNMPITPGVYGQANSGQFIIKLNASLTLQEWNTTIGTGSGEIDISPTAFLVSDCEQIYFSGWGGEVNSSFCQFNPCYASSSTTNGLPVTNDAFQPNTDGSDFYLCVLTPNGADLLYASFLGGNESSEHVDGGTSRFDKNGSVYQAVCAGCQNNDDFPTTPGVWSNTNESNGCNLAVFRFDLNAVQAHVEIDGPDEVCIDDPVSFINESVGASSYFWIFGDGETSEEFEPSHAFAEPGTYTIQLVGMDDALCVNSDTAEVMLTILPGVDPSVEPGGLICQGESFQLQAYGSENLHWMGSGSLSATDIPNPVATPIVTTEYFVVDENECASETLSVVVEVSTITSSISDDVSICIGENTQLIASGGSDYIWTPATGLSNASIADPVSTPFVTTTYTATISNDEGCSEEQTVTVTVFNNSPGGEQYDDLTICVGDYTQLNANPGTSWTWSPSSSLNSAFMQNPIASPEDTTVYTVLILNACGQGTDTVTVNVIVPLISADGGGTICAGDSVLAFATGGNSYYWNPPLYASPNNAAVTSLTPPESMWFTVFGYDEFNCSGHDSVFVFVHEIAQVDAGPDQYFEAPGSVYLFGNAFSYDFYWWPSEGLSCTDCIYPVASPLVETWYHLAVIDHNGCVSDDSVFVKPFFPVWVPNAITPNSDGINDVFRAYGVNIEGFHLTIFDRWGIKVFESFDIEEVWTGGLTNEYYVQNDVYNWVIEYDSIDRRSTIAGHVTVAR